MGVPWRWGIGHKKQLSFWHTKSKHRWQYGGILRKHRDGRGARPLSTKDPLHLVFKMDRESVEFGLRSSRAFLHVNRTIAKYAKRFYVKVDQYSVQGDHIHLLVRTSRRSHFQHFFRVVAGQIAQGLLKRQSRGRGNRGKIVTGTPKGLRAGEGLEINSGRDRGDVTGISEDSRAKIRFWLHRPYSRVVKGWRGYQTVRNYILLNEAEVTGRIGYQVRRLRGISEEEQVMLGISSVGRGPPQSQRRSV